MSSSPGLYLGGGGSEGASAPGLRGKRGGIEIQNPLPAPARTAGRLGPGLPQLPEKQLGCSIRAALKAPPSCSYRPPRGPLPPPRRPPCWARYYRRPGAGVHDWPRGTASPTGGPAGNRRGGGSEHPPGGAEARGLRASGSCLRPAGVVFLVLLPRARVLEAARSPDL